MNSLEYSKLKNRVRRAFYNFAVEKVEDAFNEALTKHIEGKIEFRNLFMNIKYILLTERTERAVERPIEEITIPVENGDIQELIERDEHKVRYERLMQAYLQLGAKQQAAIRANLAGLENKGDPNYKQALRKLRDIMGGDIIKQKKVALKSIRMGKAKGEKQGNNYNLAFVNDIRTSQLSVKELAAKYSTTPRSIRRILEKKTYKEI